MRQFNASLVMFRFVLPAFVSLVTVNSVLADQTHWTARYKRFGGVRPTAKLEPLVREIFEDTAIRNVSFEASSLRDAVPKIQALARRDISFIIKDLDYAGYAKPLRLKADKLTLAGLIDELAAQGGFYWDFSAVNLTLRPTKGR